MARTVQRAVSLREFELRRVAAEVMTAVAGVLAVAALVTFALMWVVYLLSGPDGAHRDWPGRHWFVVVPLLTVAGGLAWSVERISPETLQVDPDKP